MADGLAPALATATLSTLTIARPRLALYVMFAALPLQSLFVPVSNFFWSPADLVVLAGASALGVRLLRADASAWRTVRQHAWLGAMLVGYVIGFVVLGYASRTLLRVGLAVVPSILACELLRDRSHMARAATALIVAAAVDVTIGLVFYATGTWIHPTRFSGVGGPNFSAMIIVVAAAIGFCKVARTNSPARLLGPGALVVFAFATLSKMGALALAAASALVVPLMARRNRVLVLGTAAVLMVLALSHGTIREAMLERTQPMAQNDGVKRSSFELRWLLMRTAVGAFLEQPAAGLGFGRFQEYSLNDEDIRAATAGIGFGTHNTFLEILAEGGLLAFVPFLLHFRQYRWGAARAYRVITTRKDMVLAAALIGLPTVAVCAAFGNVLLYYHFWAVCGLALAGLTIQRMEEYPEGRGITEGGSRVTGRRVLHCIPGMGGGGAERQLAYLAGPLRDLGWDVQVALISLGPNLERLSRSGAGIHRIAASGNYDPRIGWQLVRLLGRLRPDVVQLWLFQMEIVGALAAGWHGVPWILSERSCEDAYPQTWRYRLRVAVSARAAAIVANSVEGERYWASQANVTAPRFIVPNAVPFAEIQSSTPADVQSLGFSSSGRLILSLGRFSPEKNVLTLLAALKTVMPEEPDIVAVLGGDGPLRQRLVQEHAAGPLAGRIALPGYLTAPWNWMKRADVFVSVAHFEGHPNAVLEAAACRTPLVLSDIAAHRAILDADCALFVSPDDAGAVAVAIRTVLSNPDAAHARAARAAARIANLSIDEIARQYHDIYRQILENGNLRAAGRVLPHGTRRAGRRRSKGCKD